LSLLSISAKRVENVFPNFQTLDFQDWEFPLFEGFQPHETGAPSVEYAYDAIRNASGILFGIPAYWSSISGAFKNFIEVLSGPAYDLPYPQRTVFFGKKVGICVVGADALSAARGVIQANDLVCHLGMFAVGEAVCIGNPRDDSFSFEAAIDKTVALIAELAMSVALDCREKSP
jgi:NAD(P)H-dependent FMN reductase